jgi:hypothetical protein
LRRRAASVLGVLLATLVVVIAVSIPFPAVEPVAVGLVAVCFVLALICAERSTVIICTVLGGVGIACAVVAVAANGPGDLPAVTINQDIVAMIAGVSFLRLLRPRPALTRPRLRGYAALLRTAVVTHFMGAVLNLGAVGIVGDRLARGGRLRPEEGTLLAHAYSSAAFWSPLWAAGAVALSFAPGADTARLILVGVGSAVVAILLVTAALWRRMRATSADYTGFELSWSVVRAPLAIVAVVIVAHLALPTVPVPRIVLSSAVLVVIVALLFSDPRRVPGKLVAHVREELPQMRGEVALFVAAGVLGTGLKWLISVVEIAAPISDFTVAAGWVLVLFMIGAAMAGVHPLVSLTVIGAIVGQIHPNPTAFVVAMMIGWGVSIAAGPFTGTNAFLAGRYGIPLSRLVRGGALYSIAGLLVAAPAIWIAGLP